MKTSHIFHYKNGKNKSIVIGIGKFDGFHIGHQKIIKQVVNLAEKLICTPSVFTVRNYPATYTLSSWNQRKQFFKESGIELCLWADFTDIQKFTHQDFLNLLQNICDIKGVVVGKNFRFGFHRKGDIRFLKSWAKINNIKVSIINPVCVKGTPVSSSSIKQLIKNSHFSEARDMLGRWFTVKGRCISGRGTGRKIGFPTINLELENKNCPVSDGVYACFVKHNKNIYKAAVFYGIPRMFHTEKTFEIHIPDVEICNVQGKSLTVIFVKKIRDVEQFNSQKELSEKISQDVCITKKLLDSVKLDDFKKTL